MTYAIGKLHLYIALVIKQDLKIAFAYKTSIDLERVGHVHTYTHQLETMNL